MRLDKTISKSLSTRSSYNHYYYVIDNNYQCSTSWLTLRDWKFLKDINHFLHTFVQSRQCWTRQMFSKYLLTSLDEAKGTSECKGGGTYLCLPWFHNCVTSNHEWAIGEGPVLGCRVLQSFHLQSHLFCNFSMDSLFQSFTYKHSD